MYPPEITKPMEEELTSVGFKDLKTTSEVKENVLNSKSALLIVNSVCGCAAANARPGVNYSLQNKMGLVLLIRSHNFRGY